MTTPFSDPRLLDRARPPGGLEHISASAGFDEEGFPLRQAHAQAADRTDGVLAALVKHPRWVDRDM